MRENVSIKLIKAEIENIKVILDFMEKYYSNEGLQFNRKASYKPLYDIINNNDYGILYLIDIENKIIGYTCITFGFSLEYLGRDCIIDEIYITPEFQRKDIGSYILKQIEQELIRKDFKAIHLEVHETNMPAYNFYLKNGFIVHKSSFMTKRLINHIRGTSANSK